MAVPVRDPPSVDRRDAVGQVFQNAIAAVRISTGFRLAPPAGSWSLNRAEDFDRAAAARSSSCRKIMAISIPSFPASGTGFG
jgi:hypothetical protein